MSDQSRQVLDVQALAAAITAVARHRGMSMRKVASETGLSASSITRLMQVYDKAIAWSYSNPKAIDYFAEYAHVPRDIAKQAVDEFYPREALQTGEIKGIEMTLRDALQYKYISSAVTPKDVAGLIDVVYKPAQ